MSSNSKRPLAIIGDTQRTSRLEKTLLRREQNDLEREQLLRHLFQADFDLLVHLGDMVVNGSSAAEWQEFDRQFSPVLSKGVAFLPLLGNHEYWGNRQKMFSHFATRFPWLEKSRWYARVHGELGLIALDSNVAKYFKADRKQQAAWFKNTLQEMERDASVRAILVLSHHPPFTNSAVIKGARFLADSFLPAFLASTKTTAFISGHVHGYERFAVHGKTFINSGGGGGPRLRLHQGRKARHEDQFQGAGPRPFNYLLIHPGSDRLRIEALGLDKGESHIRLIDEVTQHYSEV